MRTRPVAFLTTLALAVGGLVAAPLIASPAVAAPGGSLIYIKANNIWISTPDGRRHHQVTRDGTSGSPYRSPSMSDGGVIAAAHGFDIVRLRQNGQVLSRVDPPPLPGPVANNPIDAGPSTVAISPDGSKIAWSVSMYQCPIAASCGVRSATGYLNAAGARIGASTFFRNPSWVTNTRTVQNGGYGSQVMIHDIDGAPVHWFDDSDIFVSDTDLGDHAISRDGRFLASIRGYDASTHVIWFPVTGNARTGPPPAAPTSACWTNEAPGFTDPTFSPDGSALAWAEPDGIWIKTGLTNCASPQPSRVIVGAAEPSWSAAALNPPKTPTKPKAKAIAVKKKPKVSGKAKVGKTVRVSAGTWSPKPTKVTYRWYRGSKPIKGKAGAKKSYRLKKADRGRKLRVKVTVTRSGYQKKTVWSNRTAKVKR